MGEFVLVNRSEYASIDENLLWSSQINVIAKKISNTIGGLREIGYFVPLKTPITI